MTGVSKLLPLGAAALLAASPAAAQTRSESEGAVEIVAPVGINIIQDGANEVLISQSSITFVAPAAGGPGLPALAGFVQTVRADPRFQPSGLILQREGVYALTGTTLDHDVLSVSVASGAGAFEAAGSSADSLRLVVAQYN